MGKRRDISLEEARLIGDCLYLDWDQVDIERFRQGLGQPRGRRKRHVTSDYGDLWRAGQAVMEHMQAFPDYCVRLARLRAEMHASQVRRTRTSSSLR